MNLCFAKDRLYLIERDPEEEDDADDDDDDEDADTTEDTNPLQGRRLLVLSLQGDILQVVTNPIEPTAHFTSICCFDGKLLAGYYKENADRSGKHGMLALQGL